MTKPRCKGGKASGKTPYVEKKCIFKFHGKEFESGGAVVTEDRIVAYLGKNGVLTNWHGKKIGTYRITSTWPNPAGYRAWQSNHIHQVEATVCGVVYTGRSLGVGMLFRGKRKRGKSR